MVGYMNRESLERTLAIGPSRGSTAAVASDCGKKARRQATTASKEGRADCDLDTLLIEVEQVGPGACHTGHKSCFHHERSVRVKPDRKVEAKPLRRRLILARSTATPYVRELYDVIEGRKENPVQGLVHLVPL